MKKKNTTISSTPITTSSTPLPSVIPMNRSLTPDGNEHQTIINILAWIQTNVKKGTHARLSEYHGKSREDVIVWYEEVERVAEANNWRAVRIHTIVIAYLKGVTADYYEEKR